MTQGFEHYDQGWNARVENEPFNPVAALSWRDGWKDCDKASFADRKMMGDLPPKRIFTNDQIKHMADRFLGWRLPENFAPDAGTSFKADYNEHSAYPAKHKPTGTNLFDATQADAMVRYMVEGLPGPERQVSIGRLRELVAQGWTAPENSSKEFDCTLAVAIAEKVRDGLDEAAAIAVAQ